MKFNRVLDKSLQSTFDFCMGAYLWSTGHEALGGSIVLFIFIVTVFIFLGNLSYAYWISNKPHKENTWNRIPTKTDFK